VEVALGAAFPSVSEEDFRDNQHLIVDNVPGATLDPTAFTEYRRIMTRTMNKPRRKSSSKSCRHESAVC
jgi:hypothetical protein